MRRTKILFVPRIGFPRSPFSVLRSPFSVLRAPCSVLRSPFSVLVLVLVLESNRIESNRGNHDGIVFRL